MKDYDSVLSSFDMAKIIVDALITAKIISTENTEIAILIAEEIRVRLSIGNDIRL